MTNPIKEWLKRVAAECGSPEAMFDAASRLGNHNTRRLITEYARAWKQQLRLDNFSRANGKATGPL